ncbi:NTP transferase domain-containing protein [Peptostreptococcus porci]|uniref:NTP transferase domain-containing protein n=1 Tax=Peptostreptococcus porci TaxID=2652282 RepID=A0A6N7XHA6_9FIRM|nr:NTP transferase domain-containing protein [Peptostreptococcus porci]MDD7182180.1 NTP transferase domain-containing protein [Peptostreptococcus porci]MDY2795240.1 NTP transferase domain-containing protein [Peptostreptococcus porci]MDY4128373.1 NTP transferase domain-containing protein [Peptostreptococcus porci]MDY4561656.1 NTP transferase domain-containing protein [Peptostreptococcus porci]MDY5435184.1 NTP transferase domain-containing protein [Peptostreptococcus porci]
MKKTGAVIVAAGLSSRMKAFKPSLPFGDSTVANCTIGKLKKLDIYPITVVVGHKSDELKKSIFFDDIRYVENKKYSETQMFDSVVLGVEDIMNLCDRILIMPMDLPAILEETLEKVLSIDAELVRTTYNGQPGHPIIVSNEFAKSLGNYCGEDGLRGAMESYGSPITNVDVDDEAVYFDIDTPEEYSELIEWNYQRGKGYPIGPQIEVKLKAREVFFDETAYRLLRDIDSQKSIQQACVSVGISYSKGSKIIKDIERELGFPVVEKWTGGAGGGGSSLTKEGLRLVDSYSKLMSEMYKDLEKKYKKYFAMGLRG